MASKITGNGGLFLTTVLIWGTTWFAILGQLGQVHPVASVAWRFLAASLVMFIMCWVRGLELRISARIHLLCLVQGIALFGINYCLFYTASLNLTTGLISVVFSTMVLWNALGAFVFLGRPLDIRALLGGVIGVIGLCVLFWSQIEVFTINQFGATPLIICCIATLFASAGNLISAKTQGEGISVWVMSAYGMLYGALSVLMYAIIMNIPLQFEWSLIYLSSFLYLVLFGSVIAFGAYLTLLGRIGPGRVAYATVLFPLVALLISVLFESHDLGPLTAVAVAIVLAGNWLALSQPKVSKAACT